MAEATSDVAVLTRLIAVAGRDVVDVGCGFGQLARALDRLGARAIGIEVSDAKVSAARHAADGSGPTFQVGRGEALGLPDATQDVVVYLRSLHHVPVAAMDRALGEARRVLRDEGVLYVVEPLPEGDFFAMVSLVEDETEVRAAAQTALAGARSHGLEPVTSERYEVAGLYGDLEDVRRQIVGVDPERAPVFDAHRLQLQRLFHCGGIPVQDIGREFRQPQRVDVLRAS